MSETDHYKGKLIPTGKTQDEFSPNNPDFDGFYEKAVVIDGMVYTVEKKEDIDPWCDIFRASKNEDGSYDFEVRYYNGGCSFDEAIYEAVDKI